MTHNPYIAGVNSIEFTPVFLYFIPTMKHLLLIVCLCLCCICKGLAANEPIVIEAESGILGSSLIASSLEGVQYVYPLVSADGNAPNADTRIITFSILFPEAGSYELYARFRVGSGNYDDDSFFFGKSFGTLSVSAIDQWITLNGLVPYGYVNDGDVVGSTGSVGNNTWKWLNFSRMNATPVVFVVESPNTTKTFQVAFREDGFFLDKIAFARAEYHFSVGNLTRKEPGEDPSYYYENEATYVNPVLPGDQPDPTLFKDGNDFYASGSSFHRNAFGEIWHSKDLVHWKLLTRVIPSNWVSSLSPSGGLWGGTLTKFYGSYWYYVASGGNQYFSKASSPAGPWSTPVRVNTTYETGGIGYDNSIFVDDDGTPYMLIKPGQFVNRIQRIGADGHLTGPVINLDWVNTGKKYSWAEGPVMCKRNGWYYYFVAGNVSGGQYVLRSQRLTGDSLSWEAMGNFFENVSDAAVSFRSPNHITQPFMLADGTWWTIAHSYEFLGDDRWDAKGRQGLLHQIVWDSNGKPTGKAPTTVPQIKPALTSDGTPWRLPRSDAFDAVKLKQDWYFLDLSATSRYTLSSWPGWIKLTPGSDSTHLLQRDAGRYYSMTTRVAFGATSNNQGAGLYITNGNFSKSVKLLLTYNGGKVISFQALGTKIEVKNTIGDTVWLRIDRKEHALSAFYSADGMNWQSMGNAVDAKGLDEGQTSYNWWIGNSQGFFAKGGNVHFDRYSYRDGFAQLSVAGRDNYYGIETVSASVGKVLSNTSSFGGWFMLGGVDVGDAKRNPTKIEVTAAATQGGILEVWMDGLGAMGTKLTELAITSTGSTTTYAPFKAALSASIQGQHDLYFKFKGSKNAFYVQSIRFLAEETVPLNHTMLPEQTFGLFSNPSPNGFSIFSSKPMVNATYQIFDLNGQLLEKGGLKTDHLIGTKLPKGAYNIQILMHSKKFVLKAFKSN